MKANWYQTIGLAVIGAILPFGSMIINGGDVSAKVIIASAVTAALAALASILRSPLENPPTIGPTK